MAVSGCVSIYDNKVQVQPPGQVDMWDRNVLDQCTPHVMPHRLIQAKAGAAYPYLRDSSGGFNDQATFDKVWDGLTVVSDPSRSVTEDLKPSIDWDRQSVYLLTFPFYSVCQKVEPYGDGMTTDCYNITIPVYSWMEGSNCQQQQPTSYSVFLYIYPKENLPVVIKWVSPTPTTTPVPTLTATPAPESENDE